MDFLETLPPIPWRDRLDEFLTRCEDMPVPAREDAHAMAQSLCTLLRQAPDTVKKRFPLPEDNTLRALVESGSIEQILLMITKPVGIMTSRAPSGYAIATIAVPELEIENSFSSSNSLAHAMTGAIAGAAIGIIAAEGERGSTEG
ncbi:MAG: hypothetical protein JJ901_13655 [Erythrobacter sp.]|uniref:hypothetical protein n=1 Tax=Erythrobacter sp. TaxID=1042 RepID=UPI001B11BDDA|nr:hypothetical protein [Erythrobacter sp.]MBO6769331.1 hypothetical protein [Erythrobacter sp.]